MGTYPGRIARPQRQELAGAVAHHYDGIAHRRDLRGAGVSYEDIRSELAAGRWNSFGSRKLPGWSMYW